MTEEQLAARRLYTADEVVALLRLKPTRAVAGPARPVTPVVDIAAWALAKAHRPRSRGSQGQS